MKVELVPTAFVHQQWADVKGFLAAALEHTEDLTVEQLRADLGQNRASLYKVVEETQVIGAIAVTFQNQRNARVAFVLAIGGTWIARPEGYEQFKLLLKQAGATRIAGVGRDSIVRLWERLGFKKKYTLFEVVL